MPMDQLYHIPNSITERRQFLNSFEAELLNQSGRILAFKSNRIPIDFVLFDVNRSNSASFIDPSHQIEIENNSNLQKLGEISGPIATFAIIGEIDLDSIQGNIERSGGINFGTVSIDHFLRMVGGREAIIRCYRRIVQAIESQNYIVGDVHVIPMSVWQRNYLLYTDKIWRDCFIRSRSPAAIELFVNKFLNF